MITELTDVPPGTIGFSLEGKVSGEDYRTVLIPACEQALKTGRKVRALVVIGPDFTGYEPAAMWDDTAFGLRHFFDFEKIACVTDNETYGTAIRAVGFLMPAMVRVFKNAEEQEARNWLAED